MAKLKKVMALLCAGVMSLGMFAVGCVPEEAPHSEHVWDDGVVTTQPACEDEGEKLLTCTECDETETAEIAALGHDYQNGVCSRCGDQTGGQTGGNETGGNQGGGEQENIPIEPVNNYTYEPHISSEMPRIDINEENGSFDFATVPTLEKKGDIEYVNCFVSVSNCEEEYELTDILCEVKARGNYTLNYNKKPLRLKFDKKQKMLGLNDGEKFKNWVLLADYKDDSMLRNSTAFYLGNQLLGSDGYYTTDYRDVELYINGQYWGMYLLVEQQEVKGDRVDITEPEDDDGNEYLGTDIGYFLEYDGYFNTEDPLNKFTINYNNFAPVRRASGSSFTPNSWPAPENEYTASDHIIGYTIKSDIYSEAQRDFVASYLGNVYKLCYEAIYNDKFYAFNDTYTSLVNSTATTAEECIAAVIDIDSLVSTYIIQEICCDSDINWSSFLMDVDFGAGGDKLLRFEAPWDYDSALGNRPSCESGLGMYAAESLNPWLVMFATQNWFNTKVKAKWRSAAHYGVFDGALEQIDTAVSTFSAYYTKNTQKWGFMNVWGELCWAAQQCKNQAESAAYLKQWLTTRFSYLEAVWGASGQTDEEDVTGSKYRFEAESCTINGGIQTRQGNGASGDGYLGSVAGGAGKTISFTVTAKSAAEVTLYIGLSRRSYEANLSSWFSLAVSGKAISIYFLRTVPAGGDWHDWTSVKMANIDLKAGANSIVISTVSGDATNVDYFEFISPVTLTFSK